MKLKIMETETIYDASAKIWSGIKTQPKYGVNCSIGQIALQCLLKDPEHIAQIAYPSGRQFTNHEIATLSIRVAQHFKNLQLEQCDIIGICAANSDYIASLFFGAILAGLTVSTLDPSFDKAGIKHIFSITKPKIMFCDGAVYETIKTAFEEINLNVVIYTMQHHIQNVAEITNFIKETGLESTFKLEPLKFGYTQTAVIICSSGTTGLPKGVCTSHAGLLHAFDFNMDRETRLLCFSTLYWSTGLWCLVGGTIKGVTRIISENAFNTEDFFDIVERYKVNTSFSPPSQMAMLVASPRIKYARLSSITNYLCGGSAVPYSLAIKIQPFMPNAEIISGYGMSELSGGIAAGIISSDNSTGKLCRNVEVKVVDDDGNLLGPCQQGEFHIRSIFPFTGYYNNTEATAATYDNEGWIHSGDIGYIDNDGKVFLVDRKKDIFKYNNFHFFPTEIERVINEMAGVAEVCVFGIADEVSTHLPAAAIVKSLSCTLTEEDVYAYVATKMAHFKHLRGGVYFLNDMPKTASGKNLRRVVTQICEKLRNAKQMPHE